MIEAPLKVDFFVIGPPKCGTTTLYHWLTTNPKLFLPKEKEPHFFQFKNNELSYQGPGDVQRLKQMVTTKESEYLNLFKAKKKEQFAGDCSTMYFYSSEAIENIRSHNPNAKIIIVLRNPVDRAFSHYMHQVRDGYEKPHDPLAAFLKSEERIKNGFMPFWDYKNPGRYTHWLPEWKTAFENVLVLEYLQLMSSPELSLQKIANFLEIPNDFRVSSNQVFNKSGNPRILWLNKFLKRKTLFHKLFSSLISKERRDAIKNKILNANNRKANLQDHPNYSQSLNKIYEEDIILYNSLRS